MQVKSELRRYYREKRKTLADKEVKDRQICDNFLNSELYKNAKLLLCYAALKDEINADRIIKKALADGKNVALPRCADKSGNMDFYYIDLLSKLSVGSFGIREPNTELCEKVDSFSDCVCLVPALSFDKSGYRLGYGKGYYDKFLKKFIIISVGLCYNDCLSKALPVEQHDKAVDFIVTEREIISL
ncbi:MAG: 5-formyltetrahydrofolate cyclo-ligase [Eubacterium sp.]|nr:5-formyltetrahydrofolate cyclo-ligase [Eubacterium sp.]